MAAINTQMNRESHLDRLEQQRQALARHLADLEQQIIEAGQNLAAVNETIQRQRHRMRQRGDR